MRKVLILICAAVVNFLSAQEFIPVWPKDSMPNSKKLQIDYLEENERILQVAEPGLYSFIISKKEENRGAVLICPPGGYKRLTYIQGGFEFAKWLNTLGINAFVLIHRLPDSPDLIEREKGPVQDAQRAMKIIRANAGRWEIDISKVGVMGASAGGHLASVLGTHNEDFSIVGDTLDKYSFFPDFMILISPVITMGEYTHEGSMKTFLGPEASKEKIELYSNELHVNERTPPAFIVHAQNDKTVSPLNSILFFQSLMKYGVKGSLHVFPEGGHSIGIRNNPGSTDLWTELCRKWLTGIEIME